MKVYVGYTGGSKADPTYYSLGDHTETTQIEFDPQQISYERLLETFWTLHQPMRPAFSVQYRSAVFTHGPEQERLAREVKTRVEHKLGAKLSTDIEPAGQFYLAEDYHQKYYLRQTPLGRVYAAIYPDWREFAMSTAVARANGFVGGSGDKTLLEQEIQDYGLSEPAQDVLRQLASRATGVHCAY